jgi:DNA processing protein
VARELASDLARSGVTIVSGLARGIDAYAHLSALAAGGRSIGVIACGVDRIYPPEHHELAAQLSANGAVVSDYPPGTVAEPGNFPPRNRIISGLTLGTIVVEADVRSGALITAQFAAEQGRDVFAVPGNIFNTASRGPNKLLQQGAIPVTDAQSVLRHLNINAVSEQIGLAESLPATDEERAVLAHLTHEPTGVDELIRALGRSPHEINAVLAMLELRGVVRVAGLASYALTRRGKS